MMTYSHVLTITSRGYGHDKEDLCLCEEAQHALLLCFCSRRHKRGQGEFFFTGNVILTVKNFEEYIVVFSGNIILVVKNLRSYIVFFLVMPYWQ